MARKRNKVPDVPVRDGISVTGGIAATSQINAPKEDTITIPRYHYEDLKSRRANRDPVRIVTKILFADGTTRKEISTQR